MRLASCAAVLLVVGLVRAASAETPLPERAIAVGFAGQGATVAGMSLGGGGPSVELALGDGRWQYFGEAALMWVSAGAPAERTGGALGRAGVGVRWLARAAELDSSGGIELNLEAVAGLEQLWWRGGGRVTRPDFGAGVSWQVRLYRKPKLAVRFTARALFAPLEESSGMPTLCGGSPCRRASARTPGLFGGLGVAW